MVSRRSIVCTILLPAAVACSSVTVTGPTPPKPEAITRVTITGVNAQPPNERAVVRDRHAIFMIASSSAFSQSGWSPAETRELFPLYRIELQGASGPLAVYWLGTNSHPPRFPCYSLCSGFWVSPSLVSGEIDTSRYKGLADTVAFPLFQHLPLPPL